MDTACRQRRIARRFRLRVAKLNLDFARNSSRRQDNDPRTACGTQCPALLADGTGLGVVYPNPCNAEL